MKKAHDSWKTKGAARLLLVALEFAFRLVSSVSALPMPAASIVGRLAGAAAGMIHCPPWLSCAP